MNKKGAICLYGQPRFFYCNHTLLHLINEYELDVFFHVWWQPNHSYSYAPWANIQQDIQVNDEHIDQLLEMYKPISYIIEPPRQFDTNATFENETNEYMRKVGEYIRNGNLKSQYYSWMKSAEIRQKYEQEHGFQYDFVVKARFDTYIHRPIFIDEMNFDQLNVPDNCYQDVHVYNDNFSISSSAIHNIVCNLYNNVELYIEQGVPYIAEELFKHHVDSHNIDVVKQDIEQLFFRGVNFINP